ncbi:MAG: 16S rRNA (cytosine(967)-C(5))-methyltransferase RsmB [Anaerofustis stercorihominis]|nr:16S rRNA (cytosine(967)-C(5))-methyltransferase RsmB [Anaerofustis stercorihominis]
MKVKISPARTAAYKILYDVIENKAFSNIAVNKHIDLSMKNPADRKLATAIVYGTLKKKNRLEDILAPLCTAGWENLAAGARILLMMSLYQLMYMTKQPKYAVVNDAVNLCKFNVSHGASGVVNGILRKITSDSAYTQKRREDDFSVYINKEFGVAPFVYEILSVQYTDEEIENILLSFERPSRVYIHVNTNKTTAEKLTTKLESECFKVRQTYVPDMLEIDGGSNLFVSKAFKNGEFFVQDLSGSVLPFILGCEDGDSVIDLCSAPGAKTFSTNLSANDLKIVSCDINAKKLDLVKRTAMQLGFENIRVFKRDGKFVREGEEEIYDRVICDVPCSGLGVAGRKPEILYNVTRDHIDALVKLQRSILESGFKYLKKGGVLVYSTCTLNREENEDNAKFVLENIPGIEPVKISLPFELQAEHEELKDGYLRLDPHRDKCDGFFIAAFRKV